MEGIDIKKNITAFSGAIFCALFIFAMKAQAQVETGRIAGYDRYQTAIEISKTTWKDGSSQNIVLVNGESFPDALCAAPLAKKLGAPILLTDGYEIGDSIENEIRRLCARKVYIIGGEKVILPKVEEGLTSEGLQCTRIAGEDRYDTSVKIAQYFNDVNEMFIATGEDFPDALSIAQVAAIKSEPIILSSRFGVPKSTEDYLGKYGHRKIYVIGGKNAISDDIFACGISAKRIYGDNRYDTNIDVINEFHSLFNFGTTYVVTGNDFPDALSGAAATAATSSPIVLVSSTLEDSTKGFFGDDVSSMKSVIALGGEKAVPTAVFNSIPPSNILTYQMGVDAAKWALSGLDYLTDTKSGMPFACFNYREGSMDSHADFNAGFATISAYMATGDTSYLERAKRAGDFLSSILPETGIVPQYSLTNSSVDISIPTTVGDGGQSSILQYVSYLARIDKNYIPLMDKLAGGMVIYGINNDNDLAWYKVNSITGEAIPDSTYGFEGLLGRDTAAAAEALLSAYETEPERTEYRDEAVKMLKAIWKCRNTSTNLIPESWDIKNNHVGNDIYPNGQFRYDDMGGAYIRALMLGYNVSRDDELLEILKAYTPVLVNSVYDEGINGGAFRYLTTTDGKRGSLFSLETMHGAFVATILEAQKLTGIDLYAKVKAHADHVFMTDFGVKNYMIPHQLDGCTGNYVNYISDSQLGYAVMQFPLGYEMLSHVSGDDAYRLRDNQLINKLLECHKKGDNTNSPKGFVNVVETRPPYDYEDYYGESAYMYHAFYIPSYLLYNSIHASREVTIDWQHGLDPSIFGLASSMPFWDTSKVRVEGRRLILSSVSGAGTVELKDMGFGNIASVLCDGNEYKGYNGTTLNTAAGKHSYEISW